MAVTWLPNDNLEFPDPSEISNPDGVVAIGGDLSVDRLLIAYRRGIFPWYNPYEPPVWWSPDPRCVLFPEDLKVQKSMRSYFNQEKFTVTYDQCFIEVMRRCRNQPRKGQEPFSWITNDFIEAYSKLHELGIAHSVEVWEGKELVGGLYGVSLGKVYFGESMFSAKKNASKYGFIALTRELQKLDFKLIDCQVVSQHLLSLGACTIPRSNFMEIMQKNNLEPSYIGNWQTLLNESSTIPKHTDKDD